MSICMYLALLMCHDSSVSSVRTVTVGFEATGTRYFLYDRGQTRLYWKTVVSIDKLMLVRILLLVCKFYVEI